MELTDKEVRLLQRGPKDLRTILLMGLIALAATLIYAALAGPQLAKEYWVFKSQPQLAVAVGRTLLERYAKRLHKEPILKLLEQLTSENYQEEREKLSKLETQTEREETLHRLLMSHLAREEKLFELFLLVFG